MQIKQEACSLMILRILIFLSTLELLFLGCVFIVASIGGVEPPTSLRQRDILPLNYMLKIGIVSPIVTVHLHPPRGCWVYDFGSVTAQIALRTKFGESDGTRIRINKIDSFVHYPIMLHPQHRPNLLYVSEGSRISKLQ